MRHGSGTFYNTKGDVVKQVFYDRNRLRRPAPNRRDGIDKLSTEDEGPQGPGFFKALIVAIQELLF